MKPQARKIRTSLLGTDIEDGGQFVINVRRKPIVAPGRPEQQRWTVRISYRKAEHSPSRLAGIADHIGAYLPKKVVRKALSDLLATME